MINTEQWQIQCSAKPWQKLYTITQSSFSSSSSASSSSPLIIIIPAACSWKCRSTVCPRTARVIVLSLRLGCCPPPQDTNKPPPRPSGVKLKNKKKPHRGLCGFCSGLRGCFFGAQVSNQHSERRTDASLQNFNSIFINSPFKKSHVKVAGWLYSVVKPGQRWLPADFGLWTAHLERFTGNWLLDLLNFGQRRVSPFFLPPAVTLS